MAVRIAGSTFAIQGYGNVGSYTARNQARQGGNPQGVAAQP